MMCHCLEVVRSRVVACNLVQVLVILVGAIIELLEQEFVRRFQMLGVETVRRAKKSDEVYVVAEHMELGGIPICLVPR